MGRYLHLFKVLHPWCIKAVIKLREGKTLERGIKKDGNRTNSVTNTINLKEHTTLYGRLAWAKKSKLTSSPTERPSAPWHFKPKCEGKLCKLTNRAKHPEGPSAWGSIISSWGRSNKEGMALHQKSVLKTPEPLASMLLASAEEASVGEKGLRLLTSSAAAGW